MRVGVKYCGGCNPRYDRGALVRRLAAEFPGCAFGPAEGPMDFVLVVCGCARACAEHAALRPRLGDGHKFIVTDAAEYGMLCERLKAAMGEME